MSLSRREKETHILFNELDNGATIETYNYQWKKRLNELCKLEPENYFVLEEEDKDGRAVYRANKKRLPLPRKKRTLSDEQREKLAKRLKESRE